MLHAPESKVNGGGLNFCENIGCRSFASRAYSLSRAFRLPLHKLIASEKSIVGTVRKSVYNPSSTFSAGRKGGNLTDRQTMWQRVEAFFARSFRI
jgi:hypothetical protein